MSFEIDPLFEGNFLTASIISSLDIGLKEKLSVFPIQDKIALTGTKIFLLEFELTRTLLKSN